MLRARGVPLSSIVSLLAHHSSVLLYSSEFLAGFVDPAAGMGFDKSKYVFIDAVMVFVDMSERTLERKMEAYRRCGWSESDITTAFSKFPTCMKISEEKIMAGMDFFVNELGCKPGNVAQCPVILTYDLDRRMKPRCLVARILSSKGLLKKKIRLSFLVILSEKKFLERFIVRFKGDIPELLDIYSGKLSPPETEVGEHVILM